MEQGKEGEKASFGHGRVEAEGQRQVYLPPTDPWVLSSHPIGAPSLQTWYPATPYPSPGITAHVCSSLMGICAL